MASSATEASPLSSSSVLASAKPSDNISHGVPKDWKFWCIIFSLSLSVLLLAIEFTSIGAALPTITRSLKGEQFIWVGSVYALGSSALVPLCGGLSQIIGRRPIMLSGIILFALGSTVSGAASSMNMLIAGRAVQGLGAGTITSSVHIVLSDLVTLRERGTFTGVMAISWALGGGSLAQSGNWYVTNFNLPICAVNAILVLLFLQKLSKMDIIGNILVIGSTTSVVIGLTWGGVRYPWSSARVLSPLVIGLVGLGVFVIYEIYFCKPPIVPIVMRMNWTGASGYLQNFLMAVVLATLSYWYAVFIEACKEKSPTGGGVDGFGLTYSISLIGLKTGRYLMLIYVGWTLIIIGAGLQTTLRADSSIAKAVGFQVVIGSGIGMVYVAVIFPILASIPVTQTAPAMALYVFSRNFGYIWGVTAGGAIIQNELKHRLPASFLTQFQQGAEIAFETIPIIPSLNQPLKDDVRNTFGIALKVVWQVLLGISIAGMLCSVGVKQLKLHTEIDEDWGRKDLPDDRACPSTQPPKQEATNINKVQSV
ncbi:major facilitator superfamily domain-containing protein [Russula aff. rugulosa BPL654]|nr:major facilitator superfamily domain-containing protein [Russula aff. rugulosa BPL654]